MRITVDQLENQLKDRLAPVYCVTGDEPLRMGEAADAVRRCATQAGFSTREIIEQQPGFDWLELTAAADNLSLFSDLRVIDLRLNSPKIGSAGSKAVATYLENPPPDTLLLITCPKMDRSILAAKWVQAIEARGVLVQVWPVEGRRLLPWLEKRLRARGLRPEQSVVPLLAERVEGNLLAAAQEVEKLLLLFGPGSLTLENLIEVVSDSARFDVYSLVDAALGGEVIRVQRILQGLEAEGVAPAVVLWALAREIRVLTRMSFERTQGQSSAQVLNRHRVWDKRKPLVAKGLKRFDLTQWRSLLRECATVDRILKGQDTDRAPWEALLSLATGLAGFQPLNANRPRVSMSTK